MFQSRTVRLPLIAFALLLACAPAWPHHALAQATLEANYAITLARIPIGSITSTTDIGEDSYTITTSGRASGVMRVLASGEGSLTTHGRINDGKPSPTSFAANTTSDDDKLDVKMTIENGDVTELTASPPPPAKDRVELTEANRHGIVDPLTAFMLPAADSANGLSEAVCDHTLPVFDGRRRFDLKLTFKRMDVAKAENGYKGYGGPLAVCSLTFHPVAGHRASSALIKYLSEGRDIEIAFAPVAGAGVLAPFRISVANMLGNLVVQASRFEVHAPASTRASVTTGQGR